MRSENENNRTPDEETRVPEENGGSWKFWRNAKLSIHKKLFFVLLVVSAVSFLILSIISLVGMHIIWEGVGAGGERMGHKAAEFTEDFAEDTIRGQMISVVAEKASRTERVVSLAAEEVEYISGHLDRILRQPADYKPRILPQASQGPVPSGKTYVNISDRVRQTEGITAFNEEIWLASNIADVFESMADYYPACFAGSIHGYLIAADVTADGSDKTFSDYFKRDYDPRTMGWYTLGTGRQKPAFTNVYTDSNGVRSVSIAMPYHYPDGSEAGVVGIDFNPKEVDDVISVIESSDLIMGDASFVLSPTGEVMFSTQKEGVLAISETRRDLRNSEEISLAHAAAIMTQGGTGIATITADGKEYYLAFAPIQSVGWSLGIVTNTESVLKLAQQARENIDAQTDMFRHALRSLFIRLAIWAVILLVGIFLVLFFVSEKVSTIFVKPLLTVIDGVNGIAQGDLDRKLNVKTGDEIEHLADCVNTMTDELKEYMNNLSSVTAEKERIATELDLATNIQEGMLPGIFPTFSGREEFDLFATMDTAKEVGGDFYDFYMLDEDHIALTVADVSGKGVPAALFMVIAKTVLKNATISAAGAYAGGGEPDFAAVVGQANRQLCENNKEKMFVTVFFGVLDIRTGVFAYVNGGHNPPLIGRAAGGAPRAGGSLTWDYVQIENPGFVLGVRKKASFTVEHLTLRRGDTLFLYTDGVTEAMDEEGNLYGEEQLKGYLDRAGNKETAQAILAAVKSDVSRHVGAAEQSDDITMLALAFYGKQSGQEPAPQEA